MQVRPAGVAAAADQPEVLATCDGRANGLGRQRVALQVAIPGDGAVGVAHVDGVPLAAAAATLVRVALAPTDDDAVGRGHDAHIARGHLVPGEGPQEVVRPLVVIAAGGIIGAPAAGVVAHLAGEGRVVVDVAGDAEVAGVGEPVARG